MKKLLSATKILLVIGAIAAAATGCKRATTTAPVDTAATTTMPATTTAATSTGAKSNYEAPAKSHSGAADTAVGSSHRGAATGAGSGTADDAKKMPRVRNNTGETQGTTPNTSLPVSDGSR